ncbi:MAG: hypothetical protein IPP49_16795 [Saprospiraceae bacterium]|nr:hypothetical protein [Saprospiraceae bacterium]
MRYIIVIRVDGRIEIELFAKIFFDTSNFLAGEENALVGMMIDVLSFKDVVGLVVISP